MTPTAENAQHDPQLPWFLTALHELVKSEAFKTEYFSLTYLTL